MDCRFCEVGAATFAALVADGWKHHVGDVPGRLSSCHGWVQDVTVDGEDFEVRLLADVGSALRFTWQVRPVAWRSGDADPLCFTSGACSSIVGGLSIMLEPPLGVTADAPSMVQRWARKLRAA